MPRSLPSLRTLAVLLLLVVGVVLSFSFHATAGTASVSYTATAVEPGENPDLVARAAPNVTDLDERLAGTPSRYREPIRDAAANGSFSGPLEPDLHIVVSDLEAEYVLFDGRYYAWNVTSEAETTNATIRMRPAEPATVFETVARSAATAPPEVTTAITEGTASGFTARPGLYERDGQYYAVAPTNEGALATRLATVIVGAALTPVGRGYTAVGLGLLAYRYREPTRDRPLTTRGAAATAALSVPIALLGAALLESGSAARFVTGPASAFVVAAGVVAGRFAARREWARLFGASVGTALLAGVAFAAALGVVGLVFGALAVLFGMAAGVVPFGYGYWFARPRPGE